jgi:hypothetical protein
MKNTINHTIHANCKKAKGKKDKKMSREMIRRDGFQKARK